MCRTSGGKVASTSPSAGKKKMNGKILRFPGNAQVVESGGHHSARWKPTRAHSHQQQRQKQDQIRHSKQRRSHDSAGAVAPFSAVRRAPYSEGNRDQPCQQQRGSGQEHSISGSNGQKRRNRRAVCEGSSKIPAQNRMQPMFVANRQRLIEAVLRAQRGECMRGNLWVQTNRRKKVARR